ncbi:G-protein coupled receptor 37-like 1, partial [Gouania willdenowi]|uniref:G-protein coupled receptor 37-like 1 n=1 Tax=Gouania willdenowi TaxID=441366 RepID=UPI0010569296
MFSLCVALQLAVLVLSGAAQVVLENPSSEVRLEPVWTSDQVPLPEELLDLDSERRHRMSRGADEDEQLSTFGRSFENEWVTTPHLTDLHNATNAVSHANASRPDLFPLLTQRPLVAYGVLAAAALLLAVGVVGNMGVMCIVWNNYYMRSAWNYLLACMAFWDFLVLVLCLPVVVLQQLSHRTILSDITCRMVPYMEVASLGITSFTLCALGIDRFHAATSSSEPKARPVQRCRSVLLKLLLVWLTALVLAAPELFLWQPSDD